MPAKKKTPARNTSPKRKKPAWPPAPKFTGLTQKVKRKIDLFVTQYLADYNGTAAVQRMGGNISKPVAANQANAWLKTPYCQHRIRRHIDEVESKQIETKESTLWGLREIARDPTQPGNARVAAFKQISRILGLEIQKIEHSAENPVIVMPVPVPQKAEDWEKAVIKRQAKLKAEVAKM